MPPARVLATGLNVVDILVRLPHAVRPGDKHPVDDLVVQGGGPAGNAACITASLGIPTAFLARMGRDTLSDLARAELRRCGVLDTHLIDDPHARPAVSVIEVDPRTAERTIFYNLSGYRPLAPGDITDERFGAPDLILVDGYEPLAAREMLRRARLASCPSVLDLESGPPDALLELIAMGTDVILPRAAAAHCTGRADPEPALRRLAELSAATLVVTDGPRGCWALADGALLHQPAFPAHALDTTGCGDAFHGAYAAARLFRWPLPLRLEFAALVASRVAARCGGRAYLPTPDSLRTSDLSPFSPALRQAIKDLP